MSKHGWYSSRGEWHEEPCNAYCRGDHHATVIYANVAEEQTTAVLMAMMRDNPSLAVREIVPAPEAQQHTQESLQEVGYGYDPKQIAAFLVVYREGGR